VAAYEVLLLNTAIPQIQAAQSGDTYVVPRDIAFSTVASFAAGTAALPSIVATGDTNTGIWFPAADTFAISTAGTERARITSGGSRRVMTAVMIAAPVRTMNLVAIKITTPFMSGRQMHRYQQLGFCNLAFQETPLTIVFM